MNKSNKQKGAPEPKEKKIIFSEDGGPFLWKVHTKNLLEEVLSNEGAAVLKIPVQMFAGILHEVGRRASQINDPELNGLMCRLGIYAISDPYEPDFDSKLCNKLIKEGFKLSQMSKQLAEKENVRSKD